MTSRRPLAARALVVIGLTLLATSPAHSQARQTRARAPQIYVTAAGAPLVAQGLAAPAPADTSAFQDVPAPSLRNVPNDGYAQVTVAPWVESNGWRFERGLTRARYAKLPRAVAPVAAAEAFAFGVDAILDADSADIDELGQVLRFLGAHAPPVPGWPALANIGVIDDGSPAMGEALNMLTRRNLLYRIVSRPDRRLALTVQPGSRDFPKSALANPSDFAARVREKLGDDRRLVRLYGTNTTIVRLTGDGRRTRLVLVSYSRNHTQQDVRVRLLGRFDPQAFAPYGAPAGAALADVEHVGDGTEFTVPFFSTIAIVDLNQAK